MFAFIRFPFFAADVLASNVTILQALTEGGWSTKKEEEEDVEDDKKSEGSGEGDFGNDRAENKMVQSILNKQNEDVSDKPLFFMTKSYTF